MLHTDKQTGWRWLIVAEEDPEVAGSVEERQQSEERITRHFLARAAGTQRRRARIGGATGWLPLAPALPSTLLPHWASHNSGSANGDAAACESSLTCALNQPNRETGLTSPSHAVTARRRRIGRTAAGTPTGSVCRLQRPWQPRRSRLNRLSQRPRGGAKHGAPAKLCSPSFATVCLPRAAEAAFEHDQMGISTLPRTLLVRSPRTRQYLRVSSFAFLYLSTDRYPAEASDAVGCRDGNSLLMHHSPNQRSLEANLRLTSTFVSGHAGRNLTCASSTVPEARPFHPGCNSSLPPWPSTLERENYCKRL